MMDVEPLPCMFFGFSLLFYNVGSAFLKSFFDSSHYEIRYIYIICLQFCGVDIVRSAIAFSVFTAILGSWAITFIVGGERLFGHTWDELVMYNVADKYGLTGWI